MYKRQAHAIRVAVDEALRCKKEGKKKVILFGLTGTGYFDLAAYKQYNDCLLYTSQRNFAVKLGGNTERFVPKRVASCFYFTKMQNMYVYAQIVFRDHGKLFA